MTGSKCAYCSEPFKKPYPAECCSRSCASKYQWSKKARPTKPCSQCGCVYTKNPRYSASQWERSRYCSRKCQAISIGVEKAGKQLKERPNCACGCGKRVVKLTSKWRPGHNTDRLDEPSEYFDTTKRRWYIRFPGGKRKARYRFVMEQALGRELKRSEVVHHINGDSTDDRIENLMLFASHAEHMRHHFEEGTIEPISHEGRMKRWEVAA